MEKKAEYKWVGSYPQSFPGGRTLAVGETIELDEEEVRHHLIEDLLAQGTLIPTDDPAVRETKLAERRVARREQTEGKEG